MRKLVVYITMVLNVKLALSFYISIYMQNQCLIFYQTGHLSGTPFPDGELDVVYRL